MNTKEYKKMKKFFSDKILENTQENKELVSKLLWKMVEKDIIADFELVDKIENPDNTITKYYTIYKHIDEVKEGESQVYDYEFAITWQK